MARRQQSVSRPLSVASPAASAPPASQPVPEPSNGGGLKFSIVDLDKVPMFVPGGGVAVKKYADIEAALRSLGKGKSLSIPVPKVEGTDTLMDSAKFASNVLSSIRRAIPETRSRATKDTLYLWMGDVAEVEARRAKAASRTANKGAA